MDKEIKIFSVNYYKFLKFFLENTKKSLWFLARDAFLFALVLVLLTILFGEFLFYKYVISIGVKELDIDSRVVKFQKDTHNFVFEELKNRENIFKNPTDVNYKSPF